MFTRCNVEGAELFQQWRSITVILTVSGAHEGFARELRRYYEEDW